MRNNLFIVFTILLVAVDGSASIQTTSSHQNGKIRGTIVDQFDARIITAEVSAKNENSQNTIKVNDIGEFDLNLPIGIYEVTIQAQGFCSFRRKEVIVKANKTVELNTTLAVRGAPSRCVDYDYFALVDPSNNEDFISIGYAEKLSRGASAAYKSGFLPASGDIQVSVSYRGIQFTAEKVVLNLRTFDLEATGNVVMVEGEKKKKLDHLSLRWNKKIAARRTVILE